MNVRMTMTGPNDWTDANEYRELADDTWFGLKLMGLCALLLGLATMGAMWVILSVTTWLLQFVVSG